MASSSPSWMDNPAWASDPPPTQPTHKNSYARGDRYVLSPYSPGSNNLALDVGQVFLMGDLGNRFSDAIGSQVHYTYGVSDLFGFDSSFGYSSHSDGGLTMTTLLTGLRTNLAWYDKVVPYFIFGMGFYRPSFTLGGAPSLIPGAAATPSTSVSPVLFGVHMGPGVDLALTHMIFFGAALTFHDMFGSSQQTSTGPVDVGGTYVSFLLHAGVSF